MIALRHYRTGGSDSSLLQALLTVPGIHRASGLSSKLRVIISHHFPHAPSCCYPALLYTQWMCFKSVFFFPSHSLRLHYLSPGLFRLPPIEMFSMPPRPRILLPALQTSSTRWIFLKQCLIRAPSYSAAFVGSPVGPFQNSSPPSLPGHLSPCSSQPGTGILESGVSVCSAHNHVCTQGTAWHRADAQIGVG